MRPVASFLALPASLLWVLTHASASADAAAPSEQWPRDLPAHAKYWPEEGGVRQRDLEALRQGQVDAPRAPAGVRKMGMDEGEKFYMEYWEFDGRQQQRLNQGYMAPPTAIGGGNSAGSLPSMMDDDDDDADDDELAGYTNATMTIPHKPALLLHTDDQTSLNPHFKRDMSYYSSLFARSPRAALAALRKRAFECPSGTSDCSAIGRSGSCCSQGEVCQVIPDTGAGSDVGCCPEGKSCSGSLGECDVGFTKCSDNIGGGCCIPLYICINQGCGPGPSLTSLILVTPTVTTKVSNPPTATASTNSTVSSSSPSSSSPSSSEAVTTTHPCPSEFRSCPATLGGGCCRTDRECGATSCPPTSSTFKASASSSSGAPSTSGNGNAPLAPVRPTSNPAPTSSSPPPMSTVTGTSCPTGFYQCNAYYRGGCCRVGRNCDTTSCPPTASSSVVNSNGVTIVVPSGGGGAGGAVASPSTADATDQAIPPTSPTVTAAPTPASGASAGAGGSVCASGWSSCPASVSGGCCPTGFSCAVTNCVAGSTGVSGAPQATGQVGKIAPSAGVRTVGFDSMVLRVVGVAVACMLPMALFL